MGSSYVLKGVGYMIITLGYVVQLHNTTFKSCVVSWKIVWFKKSSFSFGMYPWQFIACIWGSYSYLELRRKYNAKIQRWWVHDA